MIGFLPVDKPPGWTSHDVVAKVRKLTGVKKVGHAGTLDPMATGLVVLGVGRATKLLRFMQDLPKLYEARIKFGIATDTLDADGEIISDHPMPVRRSELEDVLAEFVGTLMQVPPMVSAIKIDGVRLHQLARQGIEVVREPRPIDVYGIELVEFQPGAQAVAVIRVRCGKGTYVRVLADDVARALGGRAHLTALRRLANGDMTVDEHGVTLEALADAGDRWTDALIDPAAALGHLPAVTCGEPLRRSISNGRRVETAEPSIRSYEDGQLLRMVDGHSGDLLAVYRIAGSLAVPEVVLA